MVICMWYYIIAAAAAVVTWHCLNCISMEVPSFPVWGRPYGQLAGATPLSYSTVKLHSVVVTPQMPQCCDVEA